VRVRVDPVAGRIVESRVGRPEQGDPGELARWGATPGAPACGAWLDQFPHVTAKLSSGLETDREWYALRYTSCLIRGFCDLATIRAALSDEGVHPVGGIRDDSPPMAMATLWFNVIHDSVCGQYHEVVLSIDVSHANPDAIAFRTRGNAAWALQYANFGPSVCDGQFLHSLWINSPLSISWGREMQGFPKHPKPVASTLDDRPDAFAFDLQWDGQNVMRGKAGKRFGFGPFVREGLGLVGANGPVGVTKFLATPAFDVPIVMPVKTAAQNNVPRRYMGHLWKGLSPYAVQVWPWGDGDSVELGDVEVPTGCEDHNGHTLLKKAKFEPVAVSYLPVAAAIVEVAK
jgi:hypothetical protein